MDSANFKSKRIVKLGACFFALVAMLCAEVTSTRVNDCGCQAKSNHRCCESLNSNCVLGPSTQSNCCLKAQNRACYCSLKVGSLQKQGCTCVDCKCGEGKTPTPKCPVPSSQNQSELVFVAFLNSHVQNELPWPRVDSNSKSNSAIYGLSLTSQEMCVLLSRFTC